MKNICITTLLLALVACGEQPTSEAQEQLPLSDNIDVICDAWPALTARATTIVIDPMTIDPEDRDFAWFDALMGVQYSEREPLRVLVINPITNSADLLADTCYPSFTDEEKSAYPGDWRSASLDRRERDLLIGFSRQIENSAVAARDEAGEKAVVDFDMLTVLPELSVYFSDRGVYNRVIIYSNLESRLVDDAVKELTDGVSIDKLELYSRYPFDFGLSEFIVFGFDGAGSNREREVWTQHIEQQGSIVASISASLLQSSAQQINEVLSLRGEWSLSSDTAEDGPARLHAAVSKSDGSIPIGSVGFLTEEGWLYAPFKGSYGCNEADMNCVLNARISSTVPTGSEDPFFEADIDKLELEGTSTELKGALYPGIDLEIPSGESDTSYLLDLSAD